MTDQEHFEFCNRYGIALAEKPLIASSWNLIINDDIMPLPSLALGGPTRHYGDPEDPAYLAACQRVAEALWDGEFD